MDEGKNHEDYAKQQRTIKEGGGTGCIPAASQDLSETCLRGGLTSTIRGGLGKTGTLKRDFYAKRVLCTLLLSSSRKPFCGCLRNKGHLTQKLATQLYSDVLSDIRQ